VKSGGGECAKRERGSTHYYVTVPRETNPEDAMAASSNSPSGHRVGGETISGRSEDGSQGELPLPLPDRRMLPILSPRRCRLIQASAPAPAHGGAAVVGCQIAEPPACQSRTVDPLHAPTRPAIILSQHRTLDRQGRKTLSICSCPEYSRVMIGLPLTWWVRGCPRGPTSGMSGLAWPGLAPV
jgi:hypothetical protein